MRFRDRAQAGRELADRLLVPAGDPVVVLGLPRGGVVVAHEVARRLGAPLGVAPEPGSDQGGAHRPDRWADLTGRTAVLVDEGAVTGSRMLAAVAAARRAGARRVTVAVPVAATYVLDRIAAVADEVVCPQSVRVIAAVGSWYRELPEVGEHEVCSLVRGQRVALLVAGRVGQQHAAVDEPVDVPVDHHDPLHGRLVVPGAAAGLVVFAHGAGSGAHSPRNRRIAETLHSAGIGTLLLDLAARGEGSARDPVFDIPILAGKLQRAKEFLRADQRCADLPVGYFGAGTGAAAALAAAAADPGVASVVCRGGRVDLLEPRVWDRVTVPTLLIVGELDRQVVESNRACLGRLRDTSDLVVVPGAGHLFAESDALDEVAHLTVDWFGRHLAPSAPIPSS